MLALSFKILLFGTYSFNEKAKLPPENGGGSKAGTEPLAGTALGGRSALGNG